MVSTFEMFLESNYFSPPPPLASQFKPLSSHLDVCSACFHLCTCSLFSTQKPFLVRSCHSSAQIPSMAPQPARGNAPSLTSPQGLADTISYHSPLLHFSSPSPAPPLFPKHLRLPPQGLCTWCSPYLESSFVKCTPGSFPLFLHSVLKY